jgi:hypothetical protein
MLWNLSIISLDIQEITFVRTLYSVWLPVMFPIVVGSPTVMWKVGCWAACSSGVLNCRDTGGGCGLAGSASRGASISALISENVVAGCCLVCRADGESSFAGGGGGATVSDPPVSPSGPSGSDSKSKSSSFETTD